MTVKRTLCWTVLGRLGIPVSRKKPPAGHRQLHFAFSWLVQAARARKGMPYAKRLEAEIVDAYNETGAAFKKKEDCHRMAEANRAFAHFAR